MANRVLSHITFGSSPIVTAARVHGLLDAEGLDAEVIVTPNSTEQMRGLGDGKYDIASTNFDNVMAWSGRDGRPEIIGVAGSGGPPILPVVVGRDINDWEDLRGKPLAVDAVDTAYALVLRRILLAHGLDLDKGDYTLVPEGSTGYRFESMEKGNTFAAILNPPWNKKAEEAGMKGFGDHREVLPDYPGGVYCVSREWAEANRDALLGFLRAIDGATKWVHDPATRDLAAKMVAAEEGSSEEEVAAGFSRQPAIIDISAAALEVSLGLRVQFRLTPSMGPDVAKYLDASYLEAARTG
jgi:ABC-type nitrate/sulfonate/bicarbonate transport system substrate-binding protein